jgi:hypothetical protein
MRFGFVGPSYTAKSSIVANEECINFFAETLESQGASVPVRAYGGATATALRSYFSTPGLGLFGSALPTGPSRGLCWTGTRLFAVGGINLVELAADGTQTARGTVATDGNPVSIAWSNTQLLIISAGHAYCYTLATNALVEVTASLAGVPIQVEYSDDYFIVAFQNSNKYQMSAILDGTTWPGIQVNAVSVFQDNIVSIIVNHRELWVFGSKHAQPFQDTGSLEVFAVIPGALIEKGSGATFGPCRVDNSIFWIDEDERGGRGAWRSQGYTPQRISTHAVETDLSSYASISGLVSYSYQDGGHLFWVLYIPGAPWSWVYDVTESLWHKRAFWNGVSYEAHHSWNHVYAFGMHLVGDWNSANIYQMSLSQVTDNGSTIRRLRRSPTVSDEMAFLYHAELVVEFEVGIGPQPPLTDGNGNPRAPQAMLRWIDDGKTWSNEHIADCGLAGEFSTRVVWRRIGRGRNRVYELSVSDPISWTIKDAYLRLVS